MNRAGTTIFLLSILIFSKTLLFAADKPLQGKPGEPTKKDAAPLPPPVGCNLNEIRDALTKAGNIELLGLDNTCSLYFINPKVMSGPAAQKYAETFGANLISIQSEPENTALGKALANQGYKDSVVWIGLGDQNNEGKFEWYDGSDTAGYHNWKKGEPNNSGNEDCTQIFPDGTWNDLNCDIYNSLSVIEVSLCPKTTITASKLVICKGDSSTLSTKTILGAPQYKYVWVSDPPGFTSTVESPVVTPTITTTYSVTSTDRYGCTALNTVTITVNSLDAKITASGPTTFCAGDSITLTSTAGDSYKWSNGATTQSITVSTAGVYTVRVTKGVCTETPQETITVLPKPKAGFENTTVCLGSATSFTDKSVGAVAWGWNFGDGTPPVLGQNPKHTYTKAGTYTVTLGVAAVGNCVDSIQQKVTVHDTPVVSFFSVNNCSADSIYFENTTTADPSTNITSYLYSFGDGQTSTLPDVSHLYAKGGVYKVTLTVKTADGCTGTTTISTIVDDSPVAAATGVQNICESDTAKYFNKSTLATGKLKFYWDFGDGSPVDSINSNPKHVYTAGTYTVTLAVLSDKGCGDTLTWPIEVYPAVKADFTAADVCLGQPTVFDNISTGPVTIYDWNFNDGNKSSDEEPSHTYTQAKTYMVVLSIASAKNCKSMITKKVIVHDMPVAKFKAPNVCDGKAVVFTDQSAIGPNSVINNWIWNFGDGTPVSNVASPQHVYSAVQTYDVKLKVVSNFGCADSIVKQITINPNPVVKFSAADTAGCHPFKVTFTNSSSISSGKILKWLWEFGNINSKSDLKDPPPYTFKNTSNTDSVRYTIKLTATSDSGCVTTLVKPNYITVYPKPLASFTLDPRETVVTNPVISFKNLSVGADSCTWAFDTFGSSNLFDPIPFSFKDTGVFKVTLIAVNSHGCADTTYREVIIDPDYVIYIPSAFTPNGDEVNDTFGAKGSFIMDYEMDIFDRWGGVIYQTKDINLPWNGGIKGTNKPAEEAVYVYTIKVKGTNKKTYSYKGAVTLIR